jgi:ribosomal protein S18 acetylase RimI-like enzyme
VNEAASGDLTDAELAALGARDYLGYVRQFGATPGVEIIDLAGITIRKADLPNEYLSSVFGTDVDASRLDDRIRAAIELLGRDGRAFYWPVWPTDRPSDLYERLVDRGFVEDGSAPIMALDLSRPQPPVALADDLEVREPVDRAELEVVAAFATGSVLDDPEDPAEGDPFRWTFLRLASETPPRWRFFGGWLEGRLVACAALYTGGGVAGIYAVATDESLRGRGFGRTITQAAVEAGRRAGYRWSMLMASDLGLPVYRRLGFREVGRTRFLRWPGRTSQ